MDEQQSQQHDHTEPEAAAAPVESAGDLADQAIDAAQGAIDALAAGDEDGEGNEDAGSAKPLRLADFGAAAGIAGAGGASLDLLKDVNLNVRIELGRTKMLVEDVLRLAEGSVVELDKLAGDPVDVYVNGRPVARGEVLVLNDNFCVRVNEILDPLAGG